MTLTTEMKKQKDGHVIECIRNDAQFDLEISLHCHEFTFNCPSAQQPDFGTVLITYIPDKRIAETKALKFYLQKYRYRNSFNEELTIRIMQDFVFYVQPKKVVVTLAQTSRGGIQNTCKSNYDQDDEKCVSAMLNYKPKTNFRGGWPMLKTK